LGAAPVAAQQPYVDPALRALAQSPTPENAANTLGIAVRRAPAVAIARVGFFARIRDDRAIAAINALGGTVGTRIGRLISAEVPIDAVPQLTQSPLFEVIEASRTVSVTHDSSMKAIRADLVRQASNGTWSGTAGQGVIVAIYDTGLDFTHEDFLDPAGQTRVLALWDQTVAVSTPPPGYNYGRVCTREQIQQVITTFITAACPQVDTNGHGTHVAGSAAGDGSATGNGSGTPFTFAGVAPLADLMIVKGGNGLFSETNIMDGLRWLEQQARALNRPMVVNLSLGGHTGAHDGSRLYEMLVDSLSRPGFIVVIAATNDGVNGNDKLPDGTDPARSPLLFHGSGAPGATRDHVFEVLPYNAQNGACNEFVNFSFWYEAGDRFNISIIRPDGGVVTAAFGEFVERDSPVGFVHIDNVRTQTANPLNNAYEADVRVTDCGASGAPPLNGFWTMRVTTASAPSGKPYHFWLYSQNLGSASVVRGRAGFDNRYIVGSPGNSKSAITVGAFTTRNCWPSPARPEGPVCFASVEPIGDIARFSSPGPTRDGRIKPEITAPGMAIASAFSRNSAVAANRILPDGAHVINQGTSMAAPHVTGAIALLLQHRPSLDANAVRQIFLTTADRDLFTTRTYAFSPDGRASDWWGFGKLNVCAALGALGTTGSGSGPIVITPATDTLPVNATTRFFSCSPNAATVTYISTDPAVATVAADGSVRALALGTARIIARSGTFADTAVVVVTTPAKLDVNASSAAPTETTLGTRGTVLPLLSTVLRASGYEAMQVRTLSYRLSGRDPAASLLLIADINRNRRYDVGERILERQPVVLNGADLDVDVAIDSLIVQQRDSVHVLAALELSGRAPNGAIFRAELIPARTRTTGVRSLATDQLGSITSVASSQAVSTTLAAGTTFSLSENPIRTGNVTFNFSERPKVAAIYTLNGRRVLDLLPLLNETGSVLWNLHNQNGDRVASGVYFMVFDVAGRIVREKIFVMGGAR
jgi:subtilisin family serine protease